MTGEPGARGAWIGRPREVDRSRLLEALSTVRDPELDEPITDLGFVGSLAVSGGSVRVALRLPTYFCAPNFAFMMAAEARAAVEGVEGVKEAAVVLADHFASEEINAGVAGSRDFQRAFPAHATGGLQTLRDLFRRKAFLSRQETLCRSLVAIGVPERSLASLQVGDLPATPEAGEYLARRAELGIDASASAPFLVTAAGRPVPWEAVGRHRRFAQTVRVSIEGNASLCRGLLRSRYGTETSQEVQT